VAVHDSRQTGIRSSCRPARTIRLADAIDNTRHQFTRIRADFSDAAIVGKSGSAMHPSAATVDFNDASFSADAMFYGTNFEGTAEFQPATFSGDAMFTRATFGGSSWFSETTFARRASFGQATFTGDVTFQGVDSSGDTDFSDAAFADGADRLPFKLTRVLHPVLTMSGRQVGASGRRAKPDTWLSA
jgi:uncharacterized protein YjbI with pentapeptide repeats